jgi:hypothetical protein
LIRTALLKTTLVIFAGARRFYNAYK